MGRLTWLRTIRLNRGLTLRQLSKRTGLSARRLSLMERARVSPTISEVTRIAKELGVDPFRFVRLPKDQG